MFVNGTKIIKFEAKDSEIVANPLHLGNISVDFSSSNMGKLEFMLLFLTLVLITELLQLVIY